MNNIFLRILLPICFGVFSYSASAQQRMCDLEAVCISPADTVFNGKRLPLRFGWQNLGPDTMFNRDTAFYQLTRIVEGKTTEDYKGSFAGSGKVPLSRGIYNDNYAILFHYPDLIEPLVLDYCVRITCQAISARGDTLRFSYEDTNDANNTCCKQVVVLPVPKTTAIAFWETSSDDFTLYPNPAIHTLYLRLFDGSPSDGWKLSILDLFGRRIVDKNWEELKVYRDVMSLDVRSLPIGIYQLNLVTSKGIRSKRFVVDR